MCVCVCVHKDVCQNEKRKIAHCRNSSKTQSTNRRKSQNLFPQHNVTAHFPGLIQGPEGSMIFHIYACRLCNNMLLTLHME